MDNKDYIHSLNPKGYLSNREITNLDGQYLVKGSQNVLIKNQEKVVSRKGYQLVGEAKTVNKGIKSSFDWTTNTGVVRNMRSYDDELEVWYQDEWRRVKNGFLHVNFGFTTFWNATEIIDELLFVDGSDTIYEWSGAITEVASVTADTITKKYYYAASTIAFVDSNPDTITDSASGFVTAGFSAGDVIVITGSGSNNKEVTIASVTADTITLVAEDSLIAETAGASVIIRKLNHGTWAEDRFLTAGIRKVVIDDIEYTYTGGETTGTLTGVSPSPVDNSVSAGDIVMQAVRSSNPATLDGYSLDIIGTLNNHVYYASTRRRDVWIADSSDFDDFTYTSPLRVPGEGYHVTLDSCPTAIVPDEDDMYISGGRDEWYKVTLILSADQASESVVIKKLKTAPGQAAVSQGGVFSILNGVAYLSFAKTIESLSRLGQLVSTAAVPISDDIKDDLFSYEIDRVHGVYWDRNLFITLPSEQLYIVYDTQLGHWQPPQTGTFGRFALIEVDGKTRLCAHSSVSNETYVLEEDYSDNGATFLSKAVFGYENYGSRFSEKSCDEFASELYMSQSTTVTEQVLYDYKGSTDIRSFECNGDDNERRFGISTDNASLGQSPLGSQPLGSTATPSDELYKYRFIHTTSALNFFERQRIYYSDSPDARFEIIASGENVELADSLPFYLKK